MKRELQYLLYFYENKEKELELKDIALSLNVKKPSALEEIKRFIKKDFICKTKRGKYKITKKGEEYVKKILWKHAILEWIFVKYLNLKKEKICSLIQRIEYDFPTELIEEFCIKFNHPDKCPHGIEMPHPYKKTNKKFKYCQLSSD